MSTSKPRTVTDPGAEHVSFRLRRHLTGLCEGPAGCGPSDPFSSARRRSAGGMTDPMTASTCRAAVALHSQPVELAWLREFIRTRLSDGAYPHLVLRIGLVTQA